MNLYTVGCSFTFAQMRGWPKMLADKLEQKGLKVNLINQGHPGAGNRYISHKIILDSHVREFKPDLAVIMWSGLTRKELTLDHTDDVLMSAFSGYKDYVRWAGVNTSYLLSGGFCGSWMWDRIAKETFDNLYKISNNRTMAQDTLIHIINLQNYLKQNNIPYIMSSYMNYWTDEDLVGEQDFGIRKFKDLDYLYDQIDFNKWLFINSNKDGIYELAKTIKNGLQEDGFHPEFNVHELWAEMLLNKIDKDGILK